MSVCVRGVINVWMRLLKVVAIGLTRRRGMAVVAVIRQGGSRNAAGIGALVDNGVSVDLSVSAEFTSACRSSVISGWTLASDVVECGTIVITI